MSNELARALPDAVGSGLGFDDLYRANYLALLRVVVAVTGDREVAPELVQEAFIAAHRNWQAVSAFDRPDLWVRRVAINRALSWRRRAGREARHLGRLALGRDSKPSYSMDDELWDEVRRLPRRQASVIALVYIDDLTIEQAAAADFKREISGPVPQFNDRRRSQFVPAAALLATGAVVGGLWAMTVWQEAPQPERAPLDAPTVPSAGPSPTVTTVAATTATVLTNTEPIVTTTVAAVPTAPLPERVTDTELDDFVGKFTMDYQPATVVLGSTGTVTYTLDMTESSFCIVHGGSGCMFTDDGTPLSDEPLGLGGGGARGDGVWQKYFIVPEGLTLQLFDALGPACEMHRFSLQPYGAGDVWACENTTEPPSVMDLAVTKGDRTLIATIDRHTTATTNTPKSDPVTTTGYRIGDTPATVDATLPWLLVVDQRTGTVAGYVKQLELEAPTFDKIVLVYDEAGGRIGQLGGNWQLYPTKT